MGAGSRRRRQNHACLQTPHQQGGLDGTAEVSVVVDDFDAACNVLTAIGLCCKSYQETKRETWELQDVEVTIDTWPWIPAFVELEGESEAQLKDATLTLDLDWTKALHGSVETAYQAYYDVTEEEIDSWERIVFIQVPDWLSARKKTD